ncbi:NUDIX hydrolase [Streptomyces sp. MNU103]|uniref:NUDIX hydrolase n=1 Tax=Streptomyces sp. MNU103 TaxID=2560024 RepID=UPI001E3C311F|nr:NUDIX domain-containing protein [Streptomyces sp. MNU103]
MAVTTHTVRSALAAYLDAHPEDKERLACLAELLDQVPDVTSREEFRGHVTAGAVLVDEERRVLQLHHNALRAWLLPGGHVEPWDLSLPGAAFRELVEEAGLSGGAVSLEDSAPLHIDVHPIPANPDKGEPEHWHADFRFLFRLVRDEDVTVQAEEVSGYAWRPADHITDPELRARVLDRLARL